MNTSDFTKLVRELTCLSNESEYVEFKCNKAEPDQIGENISAISNSIALLGKPRGYIIWGIEDKTQNLVGTNFQPQSVKVGNEELENWLLRLLDPRLDFRMHEGIVVDKSIVLLEVPPAPNKPVRFRGTEYIRVGSYTKKLRDFSEKERSLWRVFDQTPFEEGVARQDLGSDDVLSLIKYRRYFRMTEQPLPDNPTAILERLTSEGIIQPKSDNRYDISNVGAILFARDLQDFDRLARKALRVIIYKGSNRVETIKEQMGSEGYAAGFERAINYINDQLPQNEQIDQSLRRVVRMYPEIAIRELVANALIHQDFNITGTGPIVEIFADRMEITNPGKPLIDPLRFIDEPPRSRNETLAALMRRMAICEERGSGIDKVIFNVEMFQMPAPDFRVAGSSTVAVLYGPRKFSQMKRDERIRACYQHACLQYVSGKRLSNGSLRKRLGIKDTNYPTATRIINDTIDVEWIKQHAEGAGSKRDSSYVPFWA